MKFAIFLICSCFVVSAMGAETYPDAHDGTDIDAVLQNNHLFRSYYNCLLDEGPCSSAALTLKEILPDALATNCSKCTPRQRDIAKNLGRYMTANRPEEWSRIAQKYDPSGQYAQQFQQFINS